ncbi:TGS domain-containing protein [Candidatus Sneabacter namystus]|uniref:GTP pyrophosphokinase n=1 Tax=Candidatus Sneabacter namystus TaxID=2601646 RepID=A0A5C0UHD7_9RICK|nr:TGS domain-containing protein [Candidatus Sneabacter namystus]QEK39555.1 bifunctional (p)ppGpp synthetase/guanosine-3',5'-bis(diphosphate) 3'-pyrophosphohydrolase [Candidatus Sneabacter namystus]
MSLSYQYGGTLNGISSLEQKVVHLVQDRKNVDLSCLNFAFDLIRSKCFSQERYEAYLRSLYVGVFAAKKGFDLDLVLLSILYYPIKEKVLANRDVSGLLKKEYLTCMSRIIAPDDHKKLLSEIVYSGDFVLEGIIDKAVFIGIATYVCKMDMEDKLGENEKIALALDGLRIYAPVASRVGMFCIKDSIEDKSFGILYPDARDSISSFLSHYGDMYDAIGKSVSDRLSNAISNAKIPYKLEYRKKTPYSIWQKILAKHQSIDELCDVIAFRVIVNSIDACYKVLGIVHKEYISDYKYFKDYISAPKYNGYRSLQTVVIESSGRRVEVQIRTQQMHIFAEYGLAAHWIYKSSKSNILNISERNAFGDILYVSHSFYKVKCFLSDGTTLMVNHGSTLLDVAFLLSYDIGMHCYGGKINGKSASVMKVISDGDLVEVYSEKNHTIDFISQFYVNDYGVREYIKDYFLKKEKKHYIEEGNRVMHRVFEIIRADDYEGVISKIMQSYGANDKEEFLFLVGKGQISPRLLMSYIDKNNKAFIYHNGLYNKLKILLSHIPFLKTLLKGKSKNSAVISATCCHPVPGDVILGEEDDLGRVTIHRSNCSTLSNMAYDCNIVFLQWANIKRKSNYLAFLKVLTLKNVDSFAIIERILCKCCAVVQNIRSCLGKIDSLEVIVSIKVSNVTQIRNIISKLNSQSCICSVKRLYNDSEEWSGRR